MALGVMFIEDKVVPWLVAPRILTVPARVARRDCRLHDGPVGGAIKHVVGAIRNGLNRARVSRDDRRLARLRFVLLVHAVEKVRNYEEIAVKMNNEVRPLVEAPAVSSLDMHVDVALIGATFHPSTVVYVCHIRSWNPVLVVTVINKEHIESPPGLVSLLLKISG